MEASIKKADIKISVLIGLIIAFNLLPEGWMIWVSGLTGMTLVSWSYWLRGAETRGE